MERPIDTEMMFDKLMGLHINLEKLDDGTFKATSQGIEAIAAHESLAVTQLQDKIIQGWQDPQRNPYQY